VHDKGVFLKKNQTTIAPRDLSLSFVSDKGWPERPDFANHVTIIGE
jgi:hypothetical protein